MEKAGGDVMVTDGLKWTTVGSAEIEKAQFRLEASVFNIDAKKARQDLKDCKWEIRNLCGPEGFATAFHRLRFKRVFVERSSFPIFQPSQITDINPKPAQYVSEKTKTDLDALRVKKNQILMTCSGTIGKVALVSKTLEGRIFSHDLIRVSANSVEDTGYVFAYLQTRTGQLMLTTNNYGAVVQHIEPEHLENVPIPSPSKQIKKEIHAKILRSFELRDKGNLLVENAERILIEELKLPNFEDLTPTLFDMQSGVQTFVVKSDFLSDRFEGSYHAPIVNKIIDCLLDSKSKVVTLENAELTKSIFIPNRFKRIYVAESDGTGTPFFSGKCLNELDPANKKYISSAFHKDRIGRQLLIKEGMILVTCSGTTGKVNIVPKHWHDWVMTHDIIRVAPASREITGYLYIWLNSEFGRQLIRRNDYGSVVPHIDAQHLQHVPVPILREKKKIKEINDLALQAIKLRSEAYDLEQSAIKQVNEQVIFAT